MCEVCGILCGGDVGGVWDYGKVFGFVVEMFDWRNICDFEFGGLCSYVVIDIFYMMVEFVGYLVG